jgi:hypothetical protein
MRAARTGTGARSRGGRRSALEQNVRRFRERLAAIKSRDLFESPVRADAERALVDLAAADGTSSGTPRQARLRREDFRKRLWVTRPRPGIDRMASAWLIRRFIAPDARFSFAEAHAILGRGQVPYDMPAVEFGHHATRCTFETLAHRFAITDPAVMALSQVVHDLDLKETRYAMPECAAVRRIVDGLRAAYTDDAVLLEHGMTVIDALYRSFAADRKRRSGRRKG